MCTYFARTVDHDAPRTIVFGLSVCFLSLRKFGDWEMQERGFESKPTICEPYFDVLIYLLILRRTSHNPSRSAADGQQAFLALGPSCLDISPTSRPAMSC